MKPISKLALALGVVPFYISAAYAGIPNHDDPTTFLGPTAKVGFTSPLTDTTAFNLAGEAGIKNFRVGGTIGWAMLENQRLKLSVDYLWQKVTYAFFSGNTDQWVNQGALGAAYQYDFMGYDYNPELGISGYISHAPNKNLSTVTGTFVNSGGVTQTFTDARRIAGSNAAGLAPGVAVQPWQGGRIGLDLNYDNVRYDTRAGDNDDAKGFGGTFKINQAVADNIVVGASAAVRQPFNNYAANIVWTNVPYYGRWNIGLDGDYTAGKNELPSTYNVSVSFNYLFDQSCETPAPRPNYKGDLKGEAPMAVPQPANNSLLDWVADPAVYLPQVLAITDGTNGCSDGTAPTLLSAIGTISPPIGSSTTPTAFHFSGSDLSYSITSNAAGGNSVTIDSSGVLHIISSGSGQIATATETVSNDCGSVSTTFTIDFPGLGISKK